jgi:hypothetical protein
MHINISPADLPLFPLFPASATDLAHCLRYRRLHFSPAIISRRFMPYQVLVAWFPGFSFQRGSALYVSNVPLLAFHGVQRFSHISVYFHFSYAHF